MSGKFDLFSVLQTVKKKMENTNWMSPVLNTEKIKFYTKMLSKVPGWNNEIIDLSKWTLSFFKHLWQDLWSAFEVQNWETNWDEPTTIRELSKSI